ncbi:hypothetical protein PR048_027744 [Dryococelus australis]|uniref:Uncharacterized protein n=1 Tax=Dryococelus australis TaxID=614101 RepID=A0ABQ9GHC4_9NEOP|nr:hypothetical protein PR048_027744 [Dryococelus australis]
MEHPPVLHKFMNGFRVIKRSNLYWAGLCSQLVIGVIIWTNGDTYVNVHDLFIIGKTIVIEMQGQSVFDYLCISKIKVKMPVEVTNDRIIDPCLLFQKFLVISQSGDLCLYKVMQYELSACPLSLFVAKNVLRKPGKSQPLEAIRNHAYSLNEALLQSIPKICHYILDGGYFLHRLKWKEGCTYNSNAEDYVNFAITHNISCNNFVGRKEDFLSNYMNKPALIHLIINSFQQKRCHIIHADADADVDIVSTAIKVKQLSLEMTKTFKFCCCTMYKTTANNCTFVKGKPAVYNIKVLRQLLGDGAYSDVLFAHAFIGCNTTSGIFGTAFQKLVKSDSILHECSRVFGSIHVGKSFIGSTGYKEMVSLFKGIRYYTLATLRYSTRCRKVSHAKTFVKPKILPPTTSATKLRSLQTYL